MMELLPFPQAPLAALRTPFRVLSQLVAGTPTMDEIDTGIRAETAALGRKRSKLEALYLPVPPVPPIAWRYECGRCRYFEPETNTCSQVGLAEDPFGGTAIHPLSWCAVWLPLRGQALFAWAREFLDPSTIRRGVPT